MAGGSATIAVMVRNRRPSDYLAFAGLVILGIIVIWGLLHAAGLLAPWLTSIFSRPGTRITVTVPAEVPAGEPFTVSWKYAPKEKGMYIFLYQCREAISLVTKGAGGGIIEIPCGAAFTVAGINSITLTPHLIGEKEQKVPLTIAYIPSLSNTAARVEGSAVVTVVPATPAKGPAPSAKPPSAMPKSPTPSTPRAPSAPPDLVVSITSVTVDPATRVGIITFDIKNIGGSATGPWYFMASLPTYGGYLYTSPSQTSLSPGDHVVNILRFDQPEPGAATVRVDPAGLIRESNESNNVASGMLGSPSASSPTSYPAGMY